MQFQKLNLTSVSTIGKNVGMSALYREWGGDYFEGDEIDLDKFMKTFHFIIKFTLVLVHSSMSIPDFFNLDLIQ